VRDMNRIVELIDARKSPPKNGGYTNRGARRREAAGICQRWLSLSEQQLARG